jgi:integrase
MAAITYVLKRPTSTEETPLFLVFRYKKKRVKLAIYERIHPDFWDFDKQRAKATKKFPEYPELNSKLDDLESRTKTIFRKFENDNKREPTPTQLRLLFENEFNKTVIEETKDEIDLFKFIEIFIEESKYKINDKTGKPFADCTISIYKNTFRLLTEFKTLKKKKIDFDTIDLDFYYEFSNFLTKNHGFATNTIGKQIKTIKTFLNEATERGINKNISFKSKKFKVLKEDTDSIYLNQNELKHIHSLDLSSNLKLDRVRDLFLVGCWTGLRFSDFSEIKKENFKNDFIEIETQKTGESVVIPIHETVKQIMEKYKGKTANSLPPTVSNSKMNAYLKDLGFHIDALHIDTSTSITKAGKRITTTKRKFELLTTHTARRSFATNLYLEGIPSFNIMRITGHRTEKAFLRYIKITPNESAKILQLHWKNKNV